MQEGFVVSDIVFGCDDPTNNSSNSPGVWPNLVLSLRSGNLMKPQFFKYQFCKGALLILTYSLGVTTLRISPGLYRDWVCLLSFQA